MSGSPDHRIVSHINFKSIRIAIIVTKIYLHIHLRVKIIFSCCTAKKQQHCSYCKTTTQQENNFFCVLLVNDMI